MWSQPASSAEIISPLTSISPLRRRSRTFSRTWVNFSTAVDFDHAGAALDGVRGTEHGIDGFGVAVALFELHQAGFHGFELLAGFDLKRR
jgi:hypothetical protein